MLMLHLSARRLILIVIAAMSFGLATGSAQAACTPTTTGLAFPAYDPLSGSAVDASSTIQIACTALIANTAYNFCISMESGSGFTGNQRQMVSGAQRMNYGLYTDAGRTTDWGSYLTGFGVTGQGYQTAQSTAVGSTTLNFNVTYYGRIASGQNTLQVAANYLSTFNNPGGPANYHTSVRWATVASGLTCATMANQTIGATTFTVTSSIVKNCTVSAATLDFGSVANLSANVDATSAVNVACTSPTAYTVGLDAGTGTGATLTNRKMTLGANTINYTMYSNAGRTVNWGTATVSGAGTGSTIAHTVYGRVFGGQPLPNPGTYSDTITATVTF